jgi:hypothetical protein
VLYAIPVQPAQIFQFNLKRLGIDVEIKYFAPGVPQQKAGNRGEPCDVLETPWAVDFADPITFFATLDGTSIRIRFRARRPPSLFSKGWRLPCSRARLSFG